MTLAQLIATHINQEMPSLRALAPDQLLARSWPAVGRQISGDSLQATPDLGRIKQWVKDQLLPACEAAEAAGREVWDALHDEETRHQVERLSICAAFLLTHFFGADKAPVHEVAAFAMLLVSFLSAGTPPRKDA